MNKSDTISSSSIATISMWRYASQRIWTGSH